MTQILSLLTPFLTRNNPQLAVYCLSLTDSLETSQHLRDTILNRHVDHDAHDVHKFSCTSSDIQGALVLPRSVLDKALKAEALKSLALSPDESLYPTQL